LGIPKFGRLGFLYAKNTSMRRPARVLIPPVMYCPDLGREAYVFECLECEKYRVWNESEGIRMCYYEFREWESRGLYDGTWDDHPENFDPETFERIQEQRRRNKEINRELELEWEELERKAAELEEGGFEDYEAEEVEIPEDEESEETRDYDDSEDEDEEEFF